MAFDSETDEKIARAAEGSPEPARARRSLKRLLETGSFAEATTAALGEAAGLFATSQFLANFCIARPEELASALDGLADPVDRDLAFSRACEEFALFEDMETPEFMQRLRLFKKRYLLRITLRDLAGRTDIAGAMDELTALAEAALEAALAHSVNVNTRRFGEPSAGRGIALIGLGKLGGEELNYSSDLDLMAVCPDGGQGGGRTSGVVGPTGVIMGRTSDREFYSKAVETLNRVLSSQTEEGLAYRVDLRLRPQGRKGEIAMPLGAYRKYYESWGRTWERMSLIRARPVAGDRELGREFMEMLEPFVWKRAVEYSDIEEIRALKKKIDSTFLRDDIKRGWGGIREAEFFVHTFQLIYGAEHRALRTYRLLNAMQGLRRINLVPERELVALREGYLYLRRVEHFLQMMDDLQTHALPSGEAELEALARKMGFPSRREFLPDLRLRRMKIKNMYNSLLGAGEDADAESLTLLEGDLGEAELEGYLSFRGVRDAGAGLRNLNNIRERVAAPRAPNERALVRRVVPGLLGMALGAESPDRALAGLDSFFAAHGITAAYLTALAEEKELARGAVSVFSLSTYLTRLFLSSPRYLNALVEEMPIRKSWRRLEEEIRRSVEASGELENALAIYKAVEWLRLGMLFLSGIMPVRDLQRCLSHLADAVAGAAAMGAGGGEGFCVVALGKHGGRELTFGSDLDLLFIAEHEEGAKAAGRVLKVITAYTDRGKLYDVDMRLRPDGAKGELSKDMAGYRDYYLHHARGWEVQALLKARPVGGDRALGLRFMELAKKAAAGRGGGITREEIAEMREKIMAGVSHEQKGVDIKLGRGGMEEVEFFIQWLQLRHAAEHPDLLVQDSLAALGRLARRGVLGGKEARTLREAYEYYARLKAFLRLNEEEALTPGTGTAVLAARFMGHRGEQEMFERLRLMREKVLEVVKP